MIKKHKTYNVKELKQLFGNNWQDAIGIFKAPPISPKPIINNFDEFDNETKLIYTHISNIIKEKNPTQQVQVWATGSRVKGTWKTKEEAEAILINYPNAKVKYSDYDYHTDAIRRPTKEEFFETLGVSVDLAGGEGHKVLIES